MPNKRVLLQIRLVREQAADHLVTHQLLAHRVRFHVLVVEPPPRGTDETRLSTSFPPSALS
jgi:hypothetical protein